ncbi:LPXTG cell wall anchor domain-containing protein [Streptomyces sp. HUAS TT3]|uniref:LPXTG cell wall anchor domain-containing protein n=1 Tax=Streptomyces sp. HUAS TT3 TaxID=3447510 RepID=UPI003F65ABC7
MSARPPLLTSLGATTLLAALWFVPSANATAPAPAAPVSALPASANTGGSGTVTMASDAAAGTADAAGAAGAAGTADTGATLALADTGGIDTTPYLLAGTLFLGVGAGFVTFSVRRSRAL